MLKEWIFVQASYTSIFSRPTAGKIYGIKVVRKTWLGEHLILLCYFRFHCKSRYIYNSLHSIVNQDSVKFTQNLLIFYFSAILAAELCLIHTILIM